jgi:hypothetical protein
MADEQKNAGAGNSVLPRFWDALAAYHAAVEDNYLNVSTTRRLVDHLRSPALVVGAGHGLIVAEIRKAGLQCDGIDFSSGMIRHAKLRRGIDVIHADARAMPIPDQTYETVIFATGVIDFTEDETAIRAMLEEARRVVRKSGKVFVAFYRLNPKSERFLSKIGLLKENMLMSRLSLEMHQLNPVQMVPWIAKNAGLSYMGAVFLLLRMSFLTSTNEKRAALRMRKLFREMVDPKSLIEAAPERHPYRDQAAIRNLFERLAIQVKQLDVFASCCIVRIQ